MLKVIAVRQNTLWKFASNFSTFFKVSRREFFRKSLTESERNDRFWHGKLLKIIEHVSYSIRYCKISLLIYSECTSLSNAGPLFFTHPVVIYQSPQLMHYRPKCSFRHVPCNHARYVSYASKHKLEPKITLLLHSPHIRVCLIVQTCQILKTVDLAEMKIQFPIKHKILENSMFQIYPGEEGVSS